MCGIAGLVRFDGLRPDEHDAGLFMASQLRHRGPDDVGGYRDAWASLGHARLSIIDPDGGHQPMSNEDGTVQVVFNGEIYNHRDLARQLRARGHQLRTRCDTEVIAHLYEEHGDAFVHQLNGMFAIALWDARQHRLLLVRDRMGIKPLYWHYDGSAVAFGSELKAVLTADEVERKIDPLALKDYLTFGHVPAPRTIFENTHKLEPGHLAVCTQRRVQIRQYWDIPFVADVEGEGKREQQWCDEFTELLEQAVSMRLEADVPLGAFLSGGVDSTAVVAAMCRHASGPVLTHTVGFDEAEHDERDKARLVAARLGTDHRELLVRPDTIETARRLVGHFDEPFADPCAVPAFHLARTARERVTVALAGDGPDEMLAGYRRYRFDLTEAATRRLAPAWLRRSAFGLAGRLYPKADWLPRHWRAKRTLQNLATDDATAHLRSVSLSAGELPDLLLSRDVGPDLNEHDPFSRRRELFARCPSPELLNRLLYLDMKTLLADEILTKVDRTSMAVGLEVRVPLLDYRLVELSARLPINLKLANGCGKRVLRQSVERWLGPEPAGIPKHGFDVPTDTWFRGPLRSVLYDELLSGAARIREWLEPRAVQRLVNNHLAGASNHGQTLWMLFMLEQWARSYLQSTRNAQARCFESEKALCAV
jgi:asparagine synthase (glutamine-hydrolysing)